MLESQIAERTAYFHEYIDLKANDRWTKTQDDDRTAAHQEVDRERHQALANRIEDTRQLIVGRKGGDFHQEDYKQQAIPRFEHIENRLINLEGL